MNEVRGGPQGRKRQCILIVEDSTTQRRYLRDGLWDYELLWAVNARDALVLAFTKRPDLILLDVNIEPPPGGDDVDDEGNPKPGKYVSGLDVCRQLKKSVLKNTPVLVLTAKSGFLPRIRGRLAHANEYLTKPLEMDVLREHIYKYLGSSQVRARLARLDRHAPQAKPPTSAERGDRRGDVEQPEAAS